MSIFESKKTKKYKEAAWNYRAIAEVTFNDLRMIRQAVAEGKRTKEEAYDYLEGTGSWLGEKLEEFEKEYDD